MIALGVSGVYITLSAPIAGQDELTVTEARALAAALVAAADKADASTWRE